MVAVALDTLVGIVDVEITLAGDVFVRHVVRGR